MYFHPESIKNSQNSTICKQPNFLKIGEGFGHFTEEDVHLTSTVKIFYINFIWGMQIKTTVKNQYTSIKMAKIKNKDTKILTIRRTGKNAKLVGMQNGTAFLEFSYKSLNIYLGYDLAIHSWVFTPKK